MIMQKDWRGGIYRLAFNQKGNDMKVKITSGTRVNGKGVARGEILEVDKKMADLLIGSNKGVAYFGEDKPADPVNEEKTVKEAAPKKRGRKKKAK